MLLFIANHIYSSKYGTFFYNNQQERNQKRVKDETISIWLEIQLRKDTEFKNDYYTKPGVRLAKIPVTDYYQLRVWKEYFFKFSDSVHDP